MAVRLAAGAKRVMLGAMKFPWPTRRWFQFSRRTLLAFVTLLAIACSWLALKVWQTKCQEAAAAELRESGATVVWDEITPPAWLRSFLGEHLIGHVKELSLAGDQVTDSRLEHLDAMKQLQTLNIAYTHVTDAGLERLQALKELKTLSVWQTKVTDAGLGKIAGLKQLESLELLGTQATDAALGKLVGLNKLQTLILSEPYVTDAGLEHLQQMKQLKRVYLRGTRVTAAGATKFRQALPNCDIYVQL